jgi:hypothetical protein
MSNQLRRSQSDPLFARHFQEQLESGPERAARDAGDTPAPAQRQGLPDQSTQPALRSSSTTVLSSTTVPSRLFPARQAIEQRQASSAKSDSQHREQYAAERTAESSSSAGKAASTAGRKGQRSTSSADLAHMIQSAKDLQSSVTSEKLHGILGFLDAVSQQVRLPDP